MDTGHPPRSANRVDGAPLAHMDRPYIGRVYAANEFKPDTWVIFTLGVIITRSAGCVINDLTDRKFDKHVKRTKARPITTGNLSAKNAVAVAIILLMTVFFWYPNQSADDLSIVHCAWSCDRLSLAQTDHILATDWTGSRILDGNSDVIHGL